MKKRKKGKGDESISYYQSSTTTYQSTITYVTGSTLDDVKLKNPYFTGNSTGFSGFIDDENNDSFPIYLNDGKTITIPRGVKRQIDKLPKGVLKKIDKDLLVAKEKCLVVVSSLTMTAFNEGEEKWKSLSSEVLHEQTKKGNDNTFIYPHVMEALKYYTNSTSPIIDVKLNSGGSETYQEGVSSKQYRLNEKFDTTNVINYELITTECRSKRINYHYKRLSEATRNPIGRNLINVYQYITLPTEEEIIAYGKQLIKEGYTTKKGKLLTRLNSKPKSSYPDHKKRTFMEENIKLLKLLVSRGYRMPSIGKKKAGGRVTDSFTLMPSWIRSQSKIEGESIAEMDFTALHPNIAMHLYGGKTKYLTHQIVADELGLGIKEVKTKHLSFFNMHTTDMQRSPLYAYYQSKEPKMLENIITDKINNGYKITSRRLFEYEVSIMSESIQKLNEMDVYVLYVYDALYCKQSDVALVKEVMNRTANQFNIFTSVK